jgi:phospholipid transport system transporter-binding protein
MDIESTSPPLRLPADCSISGIRAVYELIRRSLKLQHQLEIDCSSVDKADVTSVQLLLSATRTADEQGRRVNLTAVSPILRNTFQRAGVSTGAMSNRPSAEQNES